VSVSELKSEVSGSESVEGSTRELLPRLLEGQFEVLLLSLIGTLPACSLEASGSSEISGSSPELGRFRRSRSLKRSSNLVISSKALSLAFSSFSS
jgi:hypothetical protein